MMISIYTVFCETLGFVLALVALVPLTTTDQDVSIEALMEKLVTDP